MYITYSRKLFIGMKTFVKIFISRLKIKLSIGVLFKKKKYFNCVFKVFTDIQVKQFRSKFFFDYLDR